MGEPQRYDSDRIGMNFQGFRIRLPDPRQLGDQVERQRDWLGGRVTDWLAQRLSDPRLWYMNRHTVAGGAAIGLFLSWIPFPLQMLLAAAVAAVLRVHVPVSVVMVWFTNPLTYAPLLYCAYRIGSVIVGTEPLARPPRLSWSGLLELWQHAWPALVTGSLFCACLTAVIGFFLAHLIWRVAVIRHWRSRRRQARFP